MKIYDDGELTEEATIRKFRIIQTEGSRQVNREVIHYNLQMGLLAMCTLLVALNASFYGITLSPTTSLGLIFFISAFGGLGHCCLVMLCYNATEEYLPKSRIADGNAVAYIAICIAGSVGLAVMQAISNAVAASKVSVGMKDLAALATEYETAMLVAGLRGTALE